MKRFNVTGLCLPEEDYMVDISDKIAEIKKLIDDRSYFTINRARQYGKTTTLAMLRRALKEEYLVISISFEGIGNEAFMTSAAFCRAFLKLICSSLEYTNVSDEYRNSWLNENVEGFIDLSNHITAMCRPNTLVNDKEIILMIDEVDKASNNEVFLHFLGLLRDKFMARKQSMDFTFHSVILTGVYDIKNIKLKMISEGSYTPAETEDKLYNSPWNIATDFRVDMSFSALEITTMLVEYEGDHHTGMDVAAIAKEIYSYTSGYPFLVSRICKCIDEELDRDWTLHGFQTAVNIIIHENNTLFDDVYKNLENNEKLYDLIYDILMVGGKRTYAVGNPTIDTAKIYGIIKEANQSIAISNRVFELIICNHFIAKDEEVSKRRITGILQRDVVQGSRFDMELCLRKFAEHYAQIYNELDAEFLEREGRLIFISFLKPLINGQGFYHIESQFTDFRRMDIVVDFAREQFIIELKLWRGEAEHEKAYEQLAGYMDSKGVSKGYLLTFDFRKNVNKQPYVKWVEHDGKKIFDVVV
ncbi:MAG: AAA-like domain-containing protein [Oscillospiraceae bacterium]|nr:AAA-like domain-containing protein [Oscillospiraceae bacterium]